MPSIYFHGKFPWQLKHATKNHKARDRSGVSHHLTPLLPHKVLYSFGGGNRAFKITPLPNQWKGSDGINGRVLCNG